MKRTIEFRAAYQQRTPVLLISLIVSSAIPLVAQTGLELTRTGDERSRQTQTQSAAQPQKSHEQTIGRADKAIVRAIETRLQTDRDVSAHLIDISSERGQVTLSGTVDDLFARERSEQIAESTRGVYNVRNKLIVRPSPRRDEVILRDVVHSLLLDPAAESYDVNVEVRNGIVRLTGQVHSYQESRLAENIAGRVRGVKQVRNQLNIDFQANRLDVEVAADVRSRLRNNVYLADDKFEVDVRSGTALLSGSVGSAFERNLAIASAWVIGVTAVNAKKLEVQTEVPSEDARLRLAEARRASRSQEASAAAGITQAEYGSKSQGRRNSTSTQSKTLNNGKSDSHPDSEIRDAIEAAFHNNPRLFSFKPEVEVKNGAVTLTGTVDNLMSKQTAEVEAGNVTGVRRINNFLKVRPENRPSDRQIERSVRSALDGAARLDDDQIEARALNGKVYLSGTVESYSERIQAHNITSGIMGVIAVENGLDVPYTIYDEGFSFSRYPYRYGYDLNFPGALLKKSDAELRERVEDQMFWSPFVDADEVKVSVSDGVVTLSGRVDSVQEGGSAVKNAYDAGAASVRNMLKMDNEEEGIFGF